MTETDPYRKAAPKPPPDPPRPPPPKEPLLRTMSRQLNRGDGFAIPGALFGVIGSVVLLGTANIYAAERWGGYAGAFVFAGGCFLFTIAWAVTAHFNRQPEQ